MSDSEAFRCALICGMATFTIVVSSRIMKNPRQSVKRMSHGLYFKTTAGMPPAPMPPDVDAPEAPDVTAPSAALAPLAPAVPPPAIRAELVSPAPAGGPPFGEACDPPS